MNIRVKINAKLSLMNGRKKKKINHKVVCLNGYLFSFHVILFPGIYMSMKIPFANLI